MFVVWNCLCKQAIFQCSNANFVFFKIFKIHFFLTKVEAVFKAICVIDLQIFFQGFQVCTPVEIVEILNSSR